ncbi:MAG: PmoA family protein [Verrucomicrobia bacterium]|nr:PmoA family protein [Verrucomicrobiota bacterium]
MKPLALALLAVSLAATAAEPTVTFTRQTDRVRIEIGGRHFSDYVHAGWPKPCLYPILDADGTSYTRDFPFKKNPAEVPDHDWHRGVWFAHGAVNGHDLWRELPDKQTGRIVLDQILEARDGPTGVLRLRQLWQTHDGRTLLTDETTLRITRHATATLLDYDVTLRATHGAVTLGDTEEGSMAVRINEALRVTHGKGKDKRTGTGHLVNAAGERDIPVWGKRAAWCDASGPLPDDRVIGLALLEHPQNFRHPTWWHARDYGLLSANPFGRHDFEKLKDQPTAGDHAIPAGGSLTLRYRFIFHRGDTATADIPARFRAYAAER